MPISLTFTEGSIKPQTAKQAASQITHLFLELHDLAGNSVMGPGVTNHINFLSIDESLSNGEPFVGAWVEARTPSFALSSPELKRDFFTGAVDIIEKLAEGRIKRSDIHGSLIYAVDGSWILGGEPMTNDEILEAVSKG